MEVRMGLDTDFGVKPQPPPIQTEKSRSVTDELISDIENMIDCRPFSESARSKVVEDIKLRRESGRKKYGTELKSFNGRDALTDAYQEALDFSAYLRQYLLENDSGSESASDMEAVFMYRESLRMVVWLRSIIGNRR
jgi:hypothetical protein